MSKLQTINVVEYASDDLSILGVSSFSDDEEGNREAEQLFKELVLEDNKDVTEREIDLFIEDGCYETETYQLFLTHSC